MYNRLGRGERIFDRETEAAAFVELLGKIKKPIVDVDEVLRVFGTTRRSTRAAYCIGLASRKPTSAPRFVIGYSLRFAERHMAAVLTHPPPRTILS